MTSNTNKDAWYKKKKKKTRNKDRRIFKEEVRIWKEWDQVSRKGSKKKQSSEQGEEDKGLICNMLPKDDPSRAEPTYSEAA